MKTLALSQGDLVVGRGGYATVTGSRKVQQELALALGEYFGNDRFHPTQWGSTVTDYLGQPIDDSLTSEVQAEVSRVLEQYIAIQDQEIYQDFVNGRRSRYDAADVVRHVNSIDVQVNMTTIFISVSLLTLAGQSVQLNRTVTL